MRSNEKTRDKRYSRDRVNLLASATRVSTMKLFSVARDATDKAANLSRKNRSRDGEGKLIQTSNLSRCGVKLQRNTIESIPVHYLKEFSQ